MPITAQETPLQGTYEWSYVTLSLGVATATCYLALVLVERISQSRGRGRRLWLLASAVVVGGGLWSVQCAGLLAFSLPISVAYDLRFIAFAIVPGIVAAGIALVTISRPKMSFGVWLMSSVLIGCTLIAMNDLGLAAMRMAARPRWDVSAVALSGFIAIATSLIGLRLARALPASTTRSLLWQRLGSATALGVFATALTYAPIATAHFVLEPDRAVPEFLVTRGAIAGGFLSLTTIGVLAVVLIAVRVHRRIGDREHALAQQQRYFRTVIASAPVIIIALDARGTVIVAEGRDLERLGHPAGAMIGESFAALYAHLPALVEQAQRALAGEAQAADATVAGIVLDARWTPLLDDTGAVGSVVVVATDITERRAAEIALQVRLLHDPLTNLPNRAALNERLSTLFSPADQHTSNFALAFIDLDRFKEINDTLGHDVGDALLKSVARRIDARLMTMDVHNGAARLGGDEFAVMLAQTDESRAIDIARALLDDFARPHVVGDYTLDVRASVGLALYPAHGSDAQTLLRCADVAMYVAKRGGFGFAVYDPSKDRHSKALLALEAELREAITSGGLELYYQPQVDIVSGRIFAVEALIRWQHPTLGRLNPDEFIPLAEETGLIVPLTHWVLGEAIRQVSVWSAQGIALGVAVNISMRGLREAMLPATVARLLLAHDVSPDRLVIEVTESVIMADDEQTREIFERLAAHGIMLSIDDFGTGYSSLSYLRQLSVKELKIDKSFIFPLDAADQKAAELVRLILDLGHNLGLRVVAEGVESAEVLAYLAGLGCDIAQGYFMSRPVPAAQIADLLEKVWLTDGARSTGREPSARLHV